MKMQPKCRQNDLVIQQSDGEILIYDLNSHRAFCLNEASALVWQACDGKNTISDISQTVSKKLETTVGDDFVWLALERLKKEDLITNSEEIKPNFNGLSRREVIKKIGFSSMVALPVIASLVAPLAIHAASSACPVSTFCTCFGSFTVGQTCGALLAGCPTPGCTACQVTQTCIPQEVGPPACNGFCQ